MSYYVLSTRDILRLKGTNMLKVKEGKNKCPENISHVRAGAALQKQEELNSRQKLLLEIKRNTL